MNFTILKKEVTYKAVRSGKPGGQHVNKVATKIQIIWDVNHSKAIDQAELNILKQKLKNRISSAGLLMLSVQTSRSQSLNKKRAWENLLFLLQKSLEKPTKRVATKPKKSAILKRLRYKKHLSQKKLRRKKDF